MPTYPYACTACGHAFEVQQSFTDPSLTECPECSGRLRKVFSSVGVVFKGSGFYRTDSRPSSGQDSGAASGGGTGKEKPGTGSSGSSASGDKGSGSATPAAKPAPATSSAPAASTGS